MARKNKDNGLVGKLWNGAKKLVKYSPLLALPFMYSNNANAQEKQNVYKVPEFAKLQTETGKIINLGGPKLYNLKYISKPDENSPIGFELYPNVKGKNLVSWTTDGKNLTSFNPKLFYVAKEKKESKVLLKSVDESPLGVKRAKGQIGETGDIIGGEWSENIGDLGNGLKVVIFPNNKNKKISYDTLNYVYMDQELDSAVANGSKLPFVFVKEVKGTPLKSGDEQGNTYLNGKIYEMILDESRSDLSLLKDTIHNYILKDTTFQTSKIITDTINEIVYDSLGKADHIGQEITHKTRTKDVHEINKVNDMKIGVITYDPNYLKDNKKEIRSLVKIGGTPGHAENFSGEPLEEKRERAKSGLNPSIAIQVGKYLAGIENGKQLINNGKLILEGKVSENLRAFVYSEYSNGLKSLDQFVKYDPTTQSVDDTPGYSSKVIGSEKDIREISQPYGFGLGLAFNKGPLTGNFSLGLVKEDLEQRVTPLDRAVTIYNNIGEVDHQTTLSPDKEPTTHYDSKFGGLKAGFGLNLDLGKVTNIKVLNGAYIGTEATMTNSLLDLPHKTSKTPPLNKVYGNVKGYIGFKFGGSKKSAQRTTNK